jgi:hypothetical protein
VVVIGEPIAPPEATGVRRRSEVGELTETLRARLQECFDEACGRRAGVGSGSEAGSAVVAERGEDG